jgi:para-nitrobenzyl esterase
LWHWPSDHRWLRRQGSPIRTQAGTVQGVEANGIAVYKGIPFAAPPIGSLRWRVPEAAPPWSGVRSADKFAPACIQTSNAVTTGEDCLYLNVWTPAKSANDKLAVGGARLHAASSIDVRAGRSLRQLRFAGYDCRIAVGEAQHRGVCRRSNRVTIFGQSAGGIAVSMLAASPLAKGLFQGAISQSGGNFGPAHQENEPGTRMYSVALSEKTGAAFLARLGAISIAEARKKSADEVLKSSPLLSSGFWPTFDGYVLPGDQYKLSKPESIMTHLF